MSKKIVCVLFVLALTATGAAFAAPSTFQGTCSNITFVFSGNNAAVQATCLRANGTPNQTSLVLQGIGNQGGTLTQGSGASTFQQSCGNIQIQATASGVTLSALCRTASGSSNATSLPLNGIGNNNGTLTY